VEVTERVCTTCQTANQPNKVDLTKLNVMSMSEAELSLAVFERDLDLTSSLNCLSSLDELVDILGIRDEASPDISQFTDIFVPSCRNTFTSEDRWPI